ncbi:MAG TPA: hypothetical protein VGU20_22170 [Stellaceae bacterium]|nr:hypothetical protein [Stellaceae bacterium]
MSRSRLADLTMHAPIKFELTINLEVAKALGLNVPPLLLAGGKEMIR